MINLLIFTHHIYILIFCVKYLLKFRNFDFYRYFLEGAYVQTPIRWDLGVRVSDDVDVGVGQWVGVRDSGSVQLLSRGSRICQSIS